MALNRAVIRVGLGVLGLTLMGMGQQEPAGEKITLKLDPQVNQRFEYVTTMELDFGKKGTLKGRLTTADRILEVGDESYDARHYVADSKYVGTGPQEATAAIMESTKGTQAIHTVNFRGLLVAVDGVDDPAPPNFDLILPPKPVAVGDTWDEKLRFEGDEVAIEVKFKLESFTDTEATISVVGKDVAGYKFDKPHTYIVHRTTGKVLSGQARMSMSFGGTVVDTQMKIELVSPNLRKKN